MKRAICLLLALLILPAAAETVQDQALAFIQGMGIAADAVTRIGDDIIVSLTQGGTATLTLPGDFDRYDLRWRFTGAADDDVARYLDHALTLLLVAEQKIPADTEGLAALEKIRVDGYIAVVANGLAGLENTGEQGLRVLLEQLAAQDDSALNGLRARLASRLAADVPSTDPAGADAADDALTLAGEE